MHIKHHILILLIPLTLIFGSPSRAESENYSRERILETFIKYETLNSDFIYSVSHKNGKSGKTYSELRNEVEAFAEGPFESALNSAKFQVCKFKDNEIVKKLFRVMLATTNSASESPGTVLGKIFICQPELVSYTLLALSHSEQQALYKELKFGFENAVYNQPINNNRITLLRRKFNSLKPEGNK